MLKTTIQYNIAKQRLEDSKRALEHFENNNNVMTPEDLELQVAVLLGRIDEINTEIQEYDQLTNGTLDILQNYDIFQISDIISKARIAKGWTQKKLADELEIDEQQIQRYESNDFESAKLSRVLEVIYAMDINLQFEPVFIGKIAEHIHDFNFDIEGYDIQNLKIKEKNLLNQKSLLKL